MSANMSDTFAILLVQFDITSNAEAFTEAKYLTSPYLRFILYSRTVHIQKLQTHI